MTEKVKEITDVSQMHSRPSRRCYIYSADGIPRYHLAFEKRKDGRWYGWIGISKESRATSITNPFFPMSDTAKGAVRNELGKTVFSGPPWSRREGPVKIYEFMNFKEMREHFEPIIRDRYPSFVWAQERT